MTGCGCRVERTLFLLHYISDPQIRRTIRAETTKIESFNDFLDWITFGGPVIKSGDLIIDPVKCEVHLGGRLLALTFKEYEMLKLLAINPGKVFTREALLNEVWGYDYFGGDRTVDVHVRRLRAKVEDPVHSFIETVRNVGYKFKPGSAYQQASSVT